MIEITDTIAFVTLYKFQLTHNKRKNTCTNSVIIMAINLFLLSVTERLVLH